MKLDRRALVALIMAVGVAAASCSSSEESSTSGSDASSSGSASESSSAPAEQDAEDAGGDEPESNADEPAAEEETSEQSDEPAADEELVDEPAESVYPLTVIDAAGKEFTFDEPPSLGCVWTGCAEVAAALGTTMTASVLTDEQNEWPFYGAGNIELAVEDWTNPEEWAAIDVDVVLANAAGAGGPIFTALDQAVPVFFLHYDAFSGEPLPDQLGGNEAYIENLRLMSQLVDDPAAGDVAIARFETMRERLAEYATPETAEQTLVVLSGFEGYAGLGPGSAFCQLLNETGHGTCVGQGVAEILNGEAFLALDPDIIIASSFGGQITVEDREANDPIWPLLSAVQNDRVYRTDQAQFYCCSTSAQIMMAQEYLALVFPESGLERPDQTTYDPADNPLVNE